MKYIYAALLIVLLGSVLIFAVQNHQATDVTFLSLHVSAPKSVVMVLVYLLGMISGWSVFEFIRRTLQGLRERRTPRPRS